MIKFIKIFNKKLKKNYLNLILYLLPLILFLYVLIRDQIIWKGERFDHYLIYYKFILYIFFGSLALSFLNSKMKQNILLIIFSSYFSLLIVETMFHSVSFYEKIQKKILFKKFTKKRFNENTLYEEYIKLSKFDKVDLKVWPKFFLEKKTKIFPLSSISNSNILYCNENGYFLNYKTDKYGFNNDNKIWEQAKIDHLLLGDSFVEGACVSPSDNLASQLNKITNETVLNLGQAGFGPLSQLGTYLEYVSTKKIKNIFWFYYEENDTIDLIHEKKNNTLSNYLYLDGFSQKLTDDKVNSLKDSIVKKFSKIRLARIKNSYNHDNNNFIKIKRYLILHNLRNFIFRTDNQIPKIDVTYFDIIKKMNSLSLKNDIQFNFVYLPSYSTLNLKPKKNIVDNYSRIKNFLFTENINFIDLNVEVFSNQKDNSIYFPFQKDGHYNEKGYKKIAEILAKYR